MPRPPLRVIPLGGLGEIGKNMLALEYENDIVVIDCGVLFPDENMPGVDLVIPDIAYLLERRHKIKGIIITHGHEDHIGALPYILPQLPVPVYAPPLAQGLISVKLKESQLLNGTRLETVGPGKRFKLGKFQAEFFRVCHSIPDAMGIVLETPIGTVIHTGDFKIDHTPVDGKTTDIATLTRYGSQGVLLLLSDSTYAELPGYTPSEQVVGEALDRVIGEASGRVLVATFASLISRIQQVINAAVKYRRKVAVTGRSMVDNIKMAMKMGYLESPPDLLVSVGESQKLPNNEVVLLTTGSQGEPTSALVRIANRNHGEIGIVPGDTVIISATAIPGNEKVVARTIDNLSREGARVLYDRVAMVHVHGHGSQEELKMMLNFTKPRFFVPVHGDYRHLLAHAALARSVGVSEEGIFVLEDGDVLEITPTGGAITEQVQAGQVYVDGSTLIHEASPILGERRAISKDGIVVLVVTLDKQTGIPTQTPQMVGYGFMEAEETEESLKEVASSLLDSLNHTPLSTSDGEALNKKLREMTGKLLYRATGRHPMIVPVTLEV